MNQGTDWEPELLDCVIVGAGPAGLTAAIYLRRFHRKVQVIDAGDSRAHRIRCSNNLPGFPDGLSGAGLLERMREHLRKFSGAVNRDTVVSIQREKDEHLIVYLSNSKLLTRYVILCTGVVDRMPILDGLDELVSADLLRACPVCDGYEFTGKRIGVLGNSAHSVEEAKFLRHFSSEVSFLATAAAVGATLVPALALAKIDAPAGHAVKVGVSAEQAAIVTMDDGSELSFDILYAALGADPRSGLAASLGARLDANGNVETDAQRRSTIARLFVAGDVAVGLDQISVAVGQAAVAATAVHNDLRRLPNALPDR